VAYIDWVQQEFGIAAALSGDPAMIAAYLSGDSYLAFAKQAHAVPDWATKETRGAIRDQFKQCVLGVQYGIGDISLAVRIAQLPIIARHLLSLHHELYRQFWRWSDNTVDHAMFYGWQATVFGWVNRAFENPNPRSIRNFHMQANRCGDVAPGVLSGDGERDPDLCSRARCGPYHGTGRGARRRRHCDAGLHGGGLQSRAGRL
jgi:DNA polymerase I-like protein with 3'-5' exonuclease and polymerase domains